MTESTVLLVRHGETPWNRDGRVQGWAPVGLTEAGRERARELGAAIASTYDVDADRVFFVDPGSPQRAFNSDTTTRVLAIGAQSVDDARMYDADGE